MSIDRRRRRCAAIVSALLGAGLLAVPAVAQPAGSAGAATAAAVPPSLTLVAATSSVSLPRYGKRVYLDLGTYVVAGDTPFEIRATRPSYYKPVAVSQMVGDGTVALPAGLVRDFSGFPGFFHVRVRDRAGALVLGQSQKFCPNAEGVRFRPDAPDRSPYPLDCPTQPFTLGSVWGIPAGWGVPTASWSARPAKLPLGRYTATVTIAREYRRLFDIPRADGSATVGLRVVNGNGCSRGCPRGGGPSGGGGTTQVPVPNADEPTGPSVVPADVPLPDLRSLPAYGIEVTRGDFLAFSATVWNAGPSALVVDGFRRDGQDVMDAYQYFYDAAGNQVGYAPAGAMGWDPRRGHMHWHFRNFARYRLLDADKQTVVRSRKQSFCLAATDAVNYTVPGADWRPYNTDLQTACAQHTAIAVREVLQTGSGDTYGQWRPGQSFNLTGLPNGKYFIEVAGNPRGRLLEASAGNNVSYRAVWIGGKPGSRTVRVPRVGLVDAP